VSYDVVRRIGRGGMGVVDLGVDEHGQEVALKRLSLHGTPEELATARQRIKREAEVLRALDHPGIVRLRDVVDDGDDLVLVMDHLSGGTLAQRVTEDGPLPADEVDELTDRLVDALAAGTVAAETADPRAVRNIVRVQSCRGGSASGCQRSGTPTWSPGWPSSSPTGTRARRSVRSNGSSR